MNNSLKHTLIVKFDPLIVTDDTKNIFSFSIRNWGNWDVPDDISDEEAEDCDFEELTDESIEKLDSIMKELRSTYSEYNITYRTSEKNYIYISAEKK